MTNRYLCAFLIVGATAACGDDSSTTGAGGAGGGDVVTVAGSGGHPSCEPGEQLNCQCADNTPGTKTCVSNQVGEDYFDSCANNDGPC